MYNVYKIHLLKFLISFKIIGGTMKMRKEHDFLGEIEIPDNVYYGVQTMRAMENFKITGYTADQIGRAHV